MIPKSWAGQEDGESWRLEIEDDRMMIGRPMVVTLFADHHDGTDDHTTLCCATPDQAREMAEALWHYASAADKRNAADSRALPKTRPSTEDHNG